MASSSSRVRDKWRRKEWYEVYVPSYFGGTKLADTLGDEEVKVVGRTIETTLSQITGDFSQDYLKLYFQINKIEGDRANTIFKGHEYLRDYLRSLVRRRSTKIDGIFNVTTKDNYKLRLTIVALTQKRIKTSQEKSIRSTMSEVLKQKSAELTFEQLVHEMVLGKLASDIYNETRKVAALRHVGVRKSKLLSGPA